MKGFWVNVADLLHRPGARRSEHITAPTATLSVGDTLVPAGAALTVEALLEAVSDGILATGDAAVGWTSTCRRCLRPVDGVASGTFRELYSEHPVEEDTYPVDHDRIDLELVGREAALTGLPLAPLCRDDCGGLCPACGADLNEARCGCDTAPADPRWAALSELRFDE